MKIVIPAQAGIHFRPSPLSAPGGGEGRGEVGDARALADTHLTLPIALRWVPSLSPLKGGEGVFSRCVATEQRGQFRVAAALGEGVERLAAIALGEIGAKPGFEPPGQLVRRDVAADLAAEHRFFGATDNRNYQPGVSRLNI